MCVIRFSVKKRLKKTFNLEEKSWNQWISALCRQNEAAISAGVNSQEPPKHQQSVMAPTCKAQSGEKSQLIKKGQADANAKQSETGPYYHILKRQPADAPQQPATPDGVGTATDFNIQKRPLNISSLSRLPLVGHWAGKNPRAPKRAKQKETWMASSPGQGPDITSSEDNLRHLKVYQGRLLHPQVLNSRQLHLRVYHNKRLHLQVLHRRLMKPLSWQGDLAG